MEISTSSNGIHTSNDGNVHAEKSTLKHPGVGSGQRRSRLDQLLQRNHDDYSILYNSLRFHNHSPHFLGATYLLGGSVKQLDAIYDDLVYRDILEPWKVSPGQIDLSNFRDYIGRKEYQRAWVDFFEAQLRAAGPNSSWQRLAVELILDCDSAAGGTSPALLDGLFADVGHPLIHLGYAFELDSPLIATEALALVATCYDVQLSSRLSSITRSPGRPTSNLLELFSQVHHDETLPTFDYPGDDNLPSILRTEKHLNTIQAYLNSWDDQSIASGLVQAQKLASLVLIATSPQVGGHGYDFFLVHLLTTLHGARVLVPHFPKQHYPTLMRGWLFTAFLIYTTQNRPRLDPTYVTEYDLNGRNWQYVRRQALEGPHASDAHFVKACRALMEAPETSSQMDPQDQVWFLKCAVRFASEFRGWGGFMLRGPEAEEVARQREKDGIHVMGRW